MFFLFKGKLNRYRSRKQRTEKVFKRYKRAATAVPERVWPSGVVPYYISSNFTGLLCFKNLYLLKICVDLYVILDN